MDTKKDVKWSEKPFSKYFQSVDAKYRDLWATIFFWINFAVYFVLSGFAVNAYMKSNPSPLGNGIYDGSQSVTLDTNAIILMMFVILAAVVICTAYFTAARLFTKKFIYITGILNVAAGLATSIYYFIRGVYPAAILFLIFSLFYLVAFISWIPKILFSTVVLQFVMDVTNTFKIIYLVTSLGILVSTMFSVWFSLSLVSSYVKWHTNSPSCQYPFGICSNASLVLVLIYVSFSIYWISEVVKNVIFVTICGIYGSYYYGINTAEGIPKNAASGSFKRAMTFSFGSISFGSLIVSLISMLREVTGAIARASYDQGNIIMYCLFCALQAFASVVEGLARYFNRYVFVHVALFGKRYMKSAEDTWAMLRHRGVSVLINDQLIFPVLSMGSIFVGYITALVSYIFLRLTNPAYNQAGGGFTPIIMIFSFFIGVQIANTATTAISAGIATIFISIADQPELLRQNFPNLWQEIYKHYHNILIPV